MNESEQTYFICYYIKEKMIRECPDKRTLNKIEKNIDEYVSGTLLNAEEITKAWNESVSRIHELHCKAHDSEHIKKCLRHFNPLAPIHGGIRGFFLFCFPA